MTVPTAEAENSCSFAMSYERLVVTAPIAKEIVEPAEIAPESPVVVPPPRYVPPDTRVKSPK